MKRFSKIVSVIIEAPCGNRHQRHHLRLQIGRKAGERLRHHVDAEQIAIGPAAPSSRPRRPRVNCTPACTHDWQQTAAIRSTLHADQLDIAIAVIAAAMA